MELKMENKTWIGISMVLLVAALSAVGYNITDQTYFCESRGIVMECARFSGSGLRCYPHLINRSGYKDCPEGWLKVEEPIEIERNLSEEVEVFANAENYVCDIVEGKIDSYTKCLSETNKEAYLGELI